jgi:hypothetical protein
MMRKFNSCSITGRILSAAKSTKGTNENFCAFCAFCGYSLRGVQGATRPRAGLSPPE